MKNVTLINRKTTFMKYERKSVKQTDADKFTVKVS